MLVSILVVIFCVIIRILVGMFVRTTLKYCVASKSSLKLKRKEKKRSEMKCSEGPSNILKHDLPPRYVLSSKASDETWKVEGPKFGMKIYHSRI